MYPEYWGKYYLLDELSTALKRLPTLFSTVFAIYKFDTIRKGGQHLPWCEVRERSRPHPTIFDPSMLDTVAWKISLTPNSLSYGSKYSAKTR
jgi:hypothetical protein